MLAVYFAVKFLIYVQVLRRLPEAQHRHALQCFWASAVAVVASSGAGLPTPESLQATWDAYSDMHDSEEPEATGGADGTEAAAVRAWPDIVARAHLEDEEHNIKLAYVCRELWRRYGRWQGFRVAADTFTETPNIGPGKAAFKS